MSVYTFQICGYTDGVGGSCRECVCMRVLADDDVLKWFTIEQKSSEWNCDLPQKGVFRFLTHMAAVQFIVWAHINRYVNSLRSINFVCESFSSALLGAWCLWRKSLECIPQRLLSHIHNFCDMISSSFFHFILLFSKTCAHIHNKNNNNKTLKRQNTANENRKKKQLLLKNIFWFYITNVIGAFEDSAFPFCFFFFGSHLARSRLMWLFGLQMLFLWSNINMTLWPWFSKVLTEFQINYLHYDYYCYYTVLLFSFPIFWVFLFSRYKFMTTYTLTQTHVRIAWYSI